MTKTSNLRIQDSVQEILEGLEKSSQRIHWEAGWSRKYGIRESWQSSHRPHRSGSNRYVVTLLCNETTWQNMLNLVSTLLVVNISGNTNHAMTSSRRLISSGSNSGDNQNPTHLREMSRNALTIPLGGNSLRHVPSFFPLPHFLAPGFLNPHHNLELGNSPGSGARDGDN